MASSIAYMVAEWRAARGIKQTELARLSGISVQTISAIEQGKRVPRKRTMEAIAAAFGLESYEDLKYLPATEEEEQALSLALSSGDIDHLLRLSNVIGAVARIARDDPQKLPLVIEALLKIRNPPDKR